MKRDRCPFDSEFEALLERGRIIPSASDVVRVRALARVRAIVVVATAFVLVVAIPECGCGFRIAVVVSVVLVLGAIGVAAVFCGWILHCSVPIFPSSAGAVLSVRVSVLDLLVLPEVAPEVSSIAKLYCFARLATVQESYAAEFQLLHCV